MTAEEERRARIARRDSKRLMRLTKRELVEQVRSNGAVVQELEAKIDELSEIIVDLEIRLDIDGRSLGPIERRIDELAEKVPEPSAKQLAHLEIARNLARILDRGGDNEKSAAPTAKQLDVEIAAVWAAFEEQNKPKRGVGVLKAVP